MNLTGYYIPDSNEGLASLLHTLLCDAQRAADLGQDTSAHNVYIRVLTDVARKRVAAAPPRPSANPNNIPPLPPLPPVQGRSTETSVTTANPPIGKPVIDLADCPEDGGKWMLSCEHEDGSVGILQDTNKRRLAQWTDSSLEWCCYCYEDRRTA